MASAPVNEFVASAHVNEYAAPAPVTTLLEPPVPVVNFVQVHQVQVVQKTTATPQLHKIVETPGIRSVQGSQTSVSLGPAPEIVDVVGLRPPLSAEFAPPVTRRDLCRASPCGRIRCSSAHRDLRSADSCGRVDCSRPSRDPTRHRLQWTRMLLQCLSCSAQRWPPLDDFDAPAPAATCAAPTPVSDDTAPAPAVTSTELLASKRESASGPDGLHYSIYRCAGCIGAKFLFAAYQSTVQAAARFQGFGASRTVLIVLRGQRPWPADPFARISAPVDSL